MKTSASPENDGAARFAADGLLLIVANGLAGLIFLLVHVVLGRTMSGVDYAALVSLIGLLNVLSVGSNALNVAMARFTAGDGGKGPDLRHRAFRRAALYVAPALALWFVLAVPLRGLLSSPSVMALWVLGVIAALQLFVPLAQGVVQGLRLFGWLAAAALGGALTRLLAAWWIADAGGSVSAVLGAFLLGALATLVICLWAIRPSKASPHRATDADSGPPLSRLRESGAGGVGASPTRYTLLVAAGQLILFTLMNADLILAPRLLEGDALAGYGKAAMLARALIFLPLPVVLAMFPRAVVSPRLRLLAGPLFFVLATSMLLATWVSLFPQGPLRLMYGDVESSAPAIASIYVWAVIPLALIEVLTPWLWARDRPAAVLILALPVAVFLPVMLSFAGEPLHMARALGVGGLLTFLLLLIVWRRGLPPPPDKAQEDPG